MLIPGRGPLATLYDDRGYHTVSFHIAFPRRLVPGLHTIQSAAGCRLFKALEVDAIVANTFAAAGRVRTAAKLAKLPLLVYVREYMRPIRQHQSILEDADLLLAVSNDVGDHIRSFAPKAKVTVCEDKFSMPNTPPPRKVRPNPELRVAMVGRITPYKRQHLFVRAAAHSLRAKLRSKFFVIGGGAGSDPNYEIACKQLAASLNLGDSLQFLGHRRDAAQLMETMDVVCILSDREPYPRVALEAQAAGCIVIGCRSGGVPELILDGTDGLLISADASSVCSDLLSNLKKLAVDAEWRQSLASAAQERALRHTQNLSDADRFQRAIRSAQAQRSR